jgi:hypothetical protein
MIASEEEDSQFNNPSTPITAEELWSVNEHLLNEIEIRDLSPRLRTQMEKYIRGASIRIDLDQQMEKDYRATEAAQAARTARKTTTERRVQGGGIISVQEARLRIKQRQLGDQKQEIARFNRLLQRERRPLFIQFDKAAAVARERIRRLRLLKEYQQEV